MNQVIKVLWIEEETFENLELLRIQLELDSRIALKVAGNAREACDYLAWEEFDVILVDIILPPGFDDFWIDTRSQTERLGLVLIEKIFDKSIEVLPKNLHVDKFGVFTIERQKDIINIFNSKGGPIKNKNYRNKDSIHEGAELIQFIKEINSSK